jgi:iron complex outermembrane receptor protein
MEPIVITANPMGSPTLAAPYTILDGRELDRRGADNLGATLNGLPGVWTTTYGPMVGRPVIRGMDGDRVRIMNNGLGSIDASALSYDHAVPFDANTAQRIEIVRSPAALMYGGNAVGGVVNVIDDRIPDSPIDTLGGTVQGSWGGANDSRNESVRLEAGDGPFGIRADGYLRETGDLRIPGYARSAAQRAIDPPGTDKPYGTLRDFTATSFALAAVYTLDPARPAWSLASNLSYTQRAPTFYELYANGPHDATGQYLIGNPDLDKERSWSADLALRYDHAPDKRSFGVFYTRFHNYITEVDTSRPARRYGRRT